MSEDDNKPEIKVRGRRQNTTVKKERAKVSNWLLTINSQQRYDEDDPEKDEDAEVFEDSVNEILKDLPHYVNVTEEGHSWSKDHIEDVSADYVVEWGPKTRCLHAHVLVKIKHRTKIRLDYEAIRKKIERDLGVTIYFNSKLVRPSSDDFLLEYISKYYK